MKIRVNKRIDAEDLQQNIILGTEYAYREYESEDGWRSGSTRERIDISLKVTNETENPDGTYTYDYDLYENGKGVGISVNTTNREYQKKIEMMKKKLIKNYGVNEFLIEENNEHVSIKDYVLRTTRLIHYSRQEDELDSYNRYLAYKRVSKEKEQLPGNQLVSKEEIKSENNYANIIRADNVEHAKEKVFRSILKPAIIEYLLGVTVNKTYTVDIDLGEVSNEETLKDYMRNINFNSGINVPYSLKQAVDREFATVEEIDEIRRKCISMISPKYLRKEDLFILLDSQGGKWNYLGYFQNFYDNPNEIREILKNSHKFLIQKDRYSVNVKDDVAFINGIPEEVMSREDIRDCILGANARSLGTLIREYGFEYDKDSTMKLLELAKSQYSIYEDTLLELIQNCRKNNIAIAEVLDILRKNEFNILGGQYQTSDEIEAKLAIELQGMVMFDDIKKRIYDGDYWMIQLASDITEEKIADIYESIINVANDESQEKRRARIIRLFEKEGCSKIISRIGKDKKDEIKDIVLSPNTKFSNYIRYATILKKLKSCGVDIDKKDRTKIIVNMVDKSYNSREQFERDILSDFEWTEEEEAEIKEISPYVYPAPDKDWFKSYDVVKIKIPNGKNRQAIKECVQRDGQCFSSKIITNMQGIDSEGKEIKVNNLSKWLFGVPGARGYLSISRDGQYIQLPPRTPDDAIRIINESLYPEKKKERIQKENELRGLIAESKKIDDALKGIEMKKDVEKTAISHDD